MLQEYHLKFYKSSWNFNSNRARYKEFFGCSVTNRGSVWWFVFLSSWFPLFWGVIIFSFLIIYNLFSMIVSVSYYCLMILSEFHKKKKEKVGISKIVMLALVSITIYFLNMCKCLHLVHEKLFMIRCLPTILEKSRQSFCTKRNNMILR